MITLVLKRKGIYCFFSNPKIESENELFSDKQSGGLLILELLESEMLTHTNALQLLKDIISLRDFPISNDVKDGDFLEADLAGIMRLKNLFLLLNILSSRESLKDLPVLAVCPNCGLHATIIGKGFSTKEIGNKVEAQATVKRLFEKQKITIDEKKKLLQQIKKSSLPEYDDRCRNSKMN